MKKYLLSALFFILAASLILGTQLAYERAVDDRIQSECDRSNREFAFSIEQAIRDHTHSLESLSYFLQLGPPKNAAHFSKLAEAIRVFHPGFYSINWVDASGIIQYVYPETQNRKAKKQNLLVNPYTKEFVADAKRERTPKISRNVMTYQGIEAIAMYFPIYNQDRFLGWVNAILNYESWLVDILRERTASEDIAITLKFVGEPGYLFKHGLGSKLSDSHHAHRFEILNQSFEIESTLSEKSDLVRRQALSRLIRSLLICLLCISAILHFFLLRKMEELQRSEKRLRMTRAIISSLTHDLTSPLTSLHLGVHSLAKELPEQHRHLTRLRNATHAITEIVSSMKRLHLTGLRGGTNLELEPVSLSLAIEKALDRLSDEIEFKQLKVEVKLQYEEITVQADESSLSHHVLSNVLHNAIKFSPQGGRIFVSAKSAGDEIWLTIEDEGVGMDPRLVKKIFNFELNPSRFGTDGEPGTGLGLVQVKTFMEFFGGDVRVVLNAKGGTTVQLRFTS